MSRVRDTVKSLAESLPESVGRHLAWVPYEWRLGPHYTATQRHIRDVETMELDQQKVLAFDSIKGIVNHAYQHVPFYHDFYDNHGFHPEILQTFEDIARIPIVTKSDLKSCSLERRSHSEYGRIPLNTGGTSGEPLNFYVDRAAFAREWAHLHCAWERVGYTPRDLKLTFRGKNIEKPITYNVVHNEYLVSGYHSWRDVAIAVSNVVSRREVRYMHGYPSAIYAFACYCEDERPELARRMSRNLRGILLGSEYPAPVYRDKIEQVFGTASLSWYGHSEMAILAPETDEPFHYRPFLSYGLAEAVPAGTGQHRLVGTSYFNTASPLIRYDTGDLIEPILERNLLTGFRIAEGREGEFVRDRHGRDISLTALIFGRHHPAFDFIRFIQVQQVESGHVTLHVTLTGEAKPSIIDWDAAFDLTNVALTFDIEIRDHPIRTGEGKLQLLVPASSQA